MHFYIDESGNSGKNVFDEKQPYLYYGMIASKSNIDEEESKQLEQIKHILNGKRIHAKEIRHNGIKSISTNIMDVVKRNQITFSCHRTNKYDATIILVFDQIFDSGVNEKVEWIYYNNIIKRNYTILEFAKLFSDNDVELAHKFMTKKSIQEQTDNLISLCKRLLRKIRGLGLETESSRVIRAALQWAIDNPSWFILNDSPKKRNRQNRILETPSSIQRSPNLTTFQFVLGEINEITKQRNTEPTSITIDQQLEFNKAQLDLAKYFYKIRDINTPCIPCAPFASFKNMPNPDLIKFKDSNESFGLGMTDIMLWIFKKIWEDNYNDDKDFELYHWLLTETKRLQEISLYVVEQELLRAARNFLR